MVRPITTSRNSHAVPLCMETCSESPSIVAGPSSLASSLRGNSSSITGSLSNALVFELKERLQVTSGDETCKFFPAGSSENTSEPPDTCLLSASSITFERLSLSMIVSAGATGFFRKLRATSPRGISSVPSCAYTQGGKASRSNPATSSANFRRLELSFRKNSLGPRTADRACFFQNCSKNQG